MTVIEMVTAINPEKQHAIIMRTIHCCSHQQETGPRDYHTRKISRVASCLTVLFTVKTGSMLYMYLFGRSHTGVELTSRNGWCITAAGGWAITCHTIPSKMSPARTR